MSKFRQAPVAHPSVRGEASTATPVSATVAASRLVATTPAVSSAESAAAAPVARPSSAAAHSRDVGALRSDLDVSALEDALVQDERLGNQVGFGKLNVGIACMVR